MANLVNCDSYDYIDNMYVSKTTEGNNIENEQFYNFVFRKNI